MSIEEVSSRMPKSITPARIASWESEDAEGIPTLSQLKRLSKIYRRPLAVFFLREAPREFPVPHDYRRMPGQGLTVVSPALRFELRAAQQRRLAAIQFFDDLDTKPSEFRLGGELEESVELLADRARRELQVTISEQFSWQHQYAALNTWRERIESLGVLVFQVAGILTTEMRGFSISELPLPVIGVNRAETPHARIFSMMHELTHLMLRRSSVCDFNEDLAMPPEERQVEVFCNAVAAEILAPSKTFLSQEEVFEHPIQPREWDDYTISRLSNRFRVSREFIVRRLLEHGLCTNKFYLLKRQTYHEQYLEKREGSKVVPERWGEKQQRILGDAFTRLVFNSYREGHLSLSEMLGHLQIKVKHLPQFESQFGPI